MSPDGRNALLSATVRDSAVLRRTGGAAGPTGDLPDPVGSCLLVFELATGGVRSVTSTQTDPISAFAIDESAQLLLWARSDHQLELWDLERAERIALLEGHTAKVNAIAFGAGGDRAYSCARDRTLRAWELATHAMLASFTADAALRSLAVAPDGLSVVVGDVSGRVHALQWVEPATANGPQPTPNRARPGNGRRA
jgi:WD40 repeat protein